MKNPLSDLYDQILLNEAEKSTLQNPKNEVGNLNSKQELFGEKPKPVEGPEKATLQQGPSYKETTGSATHSAKITGSAMSGGSSSKGSYFKGSSSAKNTTAEKPTEMEDTEVDPTEEEDENEKNKFKKIKKESFTMNAFETLFKKTINEEFDDVTSTEDSSAPEATAEHEFNETPEEEMSENEEGEEEEEGDLVSDLKALQDQLASILAKLEDVAEDNETQDELGEESYSEDDFDDEFAEDEDGEEESSFKESLDKPKPLNSSKGKGLMNKKNKVGKISAKGGKANSGSLKHEPKPKALGDKKTSLQKGSQVKSQIKKGDFFK
jgi:hypothetical protein